MTKKNLNIVKVQFNGTTQEEIKEEKKLFASAYNANNLKDCKQSNAYILKLDKNLLIVDCDDKQSLKYVNNLIEKYEIDPVFTKSISNKMKINKYKYHFYFKNNLNIENNKTGINGGKLDLLVNSLLFENIQEFDNIDLDNLPNVTNEFYNKLLDFNKSENPINETPQIKLNDNPKNKLSDILKCININRFENYSDWWVIGAILKEIDNKNFDLFNDYSKKCGYEKYNYNDVLSFWNNHKINNSNNKKSIYSLYSFAKEDNPTKYREFINKYYKLNNDFIESILNTLYNDATIKLKDLIYIDSNINDSIINKSICYYLLFDLGSPKLETVDYAIIFNILYKSHFIYNNNILYYYNGVYWEKQINDSKINNYVIFKMFDKLLTLINNLNLEFLKIQSTKDNKNILDSTINYINELLKNLRKIKDGNVKKKVLDEIKMHIVNNEIQFDEDPYLFCFNNKLFDWVRW
jgi:hypothetical protein